MNAKRERGTGRLFLRGNTWWCQYYFHGRQMRISTGETNEKKAGKVLKRKLAQVETGTHTDSRHIRYEDLRYAYLLDYETNGRKSLRHDGEGNAYVDCVERLNTFFEGYRASEITADTLRSFISDQQKKGLSNGSINRSLSALRRMFNLARREERLRDLPYFPMLKEAAPRSGFVERANYEKLLIALPEYLQLPCARLLDRDEARGDSQARVESARLHSEHDHAPCRRDEE